jgi:hypothetical protein
MRVWIAAEHRGHIPLLQARVKSRVHVLAYICCTLLLLPTFDMRLVNILYTWRKSNAKKDIRGDSHAGMLCDVFRYGRLERHGDSAWVGQYTCQERGISH